MFSLDVVVAWVCAVVCCIVAYRVLVVPFWIAAAMALVFGLGVWIAVGPLCGWRMLPWSARIKRWGAPDTVYSPPAPVDHVAALLTPRPVGSLAPRPSQSTEPRPLESYELAGREPCWRCGAPPVEGTHAWEDRGPFQKLSNHTFKCENGHRWTNSTDGG
ncbi:hypothetical protein [Streptomyces sp. NBC_01361]|uniref:hypothetical protein n=1 Tax=Streptomyces sp. NBC_01361 TaxID=2903838 RepID=UPI002E37E2E9|nr:hypothetical protein [Streptomyces sp. NBC_01361]